MSGLWRLVQSSPEGGAVLLEGRETEAEAEREARMLNAEMRRRGANLRYSVKYVDESDRRAAGLAMGRLAAEDHREDAGMDNVLLSDREHQRRLSAANNAGNVGMKAVLDWRDARDAFNAADDSPDATAKEWNAALAETHRTEEALVLAADSYEASVKELASFGRGLASSGEGGEHD